MVGLLESCRKMPLALLVFAGFGWMFSSVRKMKGSANVLEKQLVEPMAAAWVMRHESEKTCNIAVHSTLGCKMKSLLVSNGFLLSLTAASFVAGLTLSVYYRDFNWLSRFGALVICWGILLLARPTITGKEIGQHVIAHDSDLSLFDPKYYTLKGEAVPDWVKHNVLSRLATGVYGPIVCFLGTFANGFASLLNGVAGYAP